MNSNFIELRNIFFKIYSNIKTIELQYNTNIIINTIDEIKFSDLYKNLDIFYKLLYKIKDNYILLQGFIDNNYSELRKVKIFLLDIKKNKSRSYHDKIFTKIFKFDTYIPLGITQVFEEFVKGITFFSNEVENIKKIPIYHRSASCGSSSEDFKKKYLQCYNTNEPEEIEQKQKHIFKCYLERLIYDDMFRTLTLHIPTTLNNQELKQNKGHLFQLSSRGNNFNKCFLGMNIDINIDYINNFPVVLKIFYRKDSKCYKKETFEKLTYIDEYGNTRYQDRILHDIRYIDTIETTIQTFYSNI